MTHTLLQIQSRLPSNYSDKHLKSRGKEKKKKCHMLALSFSLAAAVTEAATAPGCVDTFGLFLSSALTTPSASCRVATLSAGNFAIASYIYSPHQYMHVTFFSPTSMHLTLICKIILNINIGLHIRLIHMFKLSIVCILQQY